MANGHLGFGYLDGVGTTPENHQQVIASQWYNANDSPIMTGGEVTGRANLAYDYAGGVGLIRTAAGAGYITWGPGTTALVPQPSVARTDTIYADRWGVHVTTSNPPANVSVLGKRRLAAGASSTGASVDVWDRRWALSRDGTWGFLAGTGEIHPHWSLAPTTKHIVANLEFWVPTDRWVDFVYKQSITSEPATDDRGSMLLQLFLDNTLHRSWESGYDRRMVQDEHTVHLIDVTQGVHTFRLERTHAWGRAPRFFGGGTDKFEHGTTAVMDVGVKI